MMVVINQCCLFKIYLKDWERLIWVLKKSETCIYYKFLKLFVKPVNELPNCDIIIHMLFFLKKILRKTYGIVPEYEFSGNNHRQNHFSNTCPLWSYQLNALMWGLQGLTSWTLHAQSRVGDQFRVIRLVVTRAPSCE